MQWVRGKVRPLGPYDIYGEHKPGTGDNICASLGRMPLLGCIGVIDAIDDRFATSQPKHEHL